MKKIKESILKEIKYAKEYIDSLPKEEREELKKKNKEYEEYLKNYKTSDDY